MAGAHPIRRTPFGRDQRPRVVEALVADPDVGTTAAGESAATGASIEDVTARVRAYAEEIVPQYNARLYHRIAYRFARRVATMLFRVRVGHVDERIYRQDPSDASVVFVINHRSNMDYVLVAFLAAEHVALSFAVGEWARIWPLDSLCRALGAFFVRRDSRNPLYRKVLERYVQLAVDAGVTQSMFLEGGLSRDGRLRAPKLGLLTYATRRFTRGAPRDLVFVPVGLNYDRVLEDRTLLADLDAGVPRRARPSPVRTALGALRWIAKNAGLYIRGRWHRFGYACVSFGPPVSLRGYLVERGIDMSALSDSERFAETERLATRLMDEIARVVPVTPVSLVASALLSFDDGSAGAADLAERVTAIAEELRARGARLYPPRRDASYFFTVGARMLTLRRLVAFDGDTYRVVPAERRVVDYYANSIAHWCAPYQARQPGIPTALAPRVAKAVILVHGLARTRRSMRRVASALRAAGYEVHNWDYPSRRFGVLDLIDALDGYARAAARSSGRLDFVTHSMGGLLARGVLGRSSLPNVGRLVMVAPPNQGAEIATRANAHRWARGVFGRALGDLSRDELGVAATLGSPACPFGIVAGTRRFHPLQPTSYYSSLLRRPGSHDGTIDVDETRLPGMADFVTVEANHTFIMDHDETIRQTLHFLEHGRFTHPAHRPV